MDRWVIKIVAGNLSPRTYQTSRWREKGDPTKRRAPNTVIVTTLVHVL